MPEFYELPADVDQEEGLVHTFAHIHAHLFYLLGKSLDESEKYFSEIKGHTPYASDGAPAASTILNLLCVRRVDAQNHPQLADLGGLWKDALAAIKVDLGGLSHDIRSLIGSCIERTRSNPADARRIALSAEEQSYLMKIPSYHSVRQYRPDWSPASTWEADYAAIGTTSFLFDELGCLPTLSIFVGEADLNELRGITWGQSVFATFYRHENFVEFGFQIDDTNREIVVPILGHRAHAALFSTLFLGTCRVSVHDVARPNALSAFSFPLFVDSQMARGIFDETHQSFTLAANNKFLDLPSNKTEFWRTDMSRHQSLWRISPQLREWVRTGEHAEQEEEYDSLLTDWFNQDMIIHPAEFKKSIPSWPEHLDDLLIREPMPSEYLAPREMFAHIDIDRHAQTLDIRSVTGDGTFDQYSVNFPADLLPALENHAGYRSNDKVRTSGEQESLALASALLQILEDWTESFDTPVDHLYYSPGHTLTHAPLQLVLTQLLKTKVSRSVSLALNHAASALLHLEGHPDIFQERPPTTSIDTFECQGPTNNRLLFTGQECSTIGDMYPLAQKRFSGKDFLSSEADVVHFSGHAIGFTGSPSSRLMLGNDSLEPVTCADILRGKSWRHTSLVSSTHVQRARSTPVAHPATNGHPWQRRFLFGESTWLLPRSGPLAIFMELSFPLYSIANMQPPLMHTLPWQTLEEALHQTSLKFQTKRSLPFAKLSMTGVKLWPVSPRRPAPSGILPPLRFIIVLNQSPNAQPVSRPFGIGNF